MESCKKHFSLISIVKCLLWLLKRDLHTNWKKLIHHLKQVANYPWTRYLKTTVFIFLQFLWVRIPTQLRLVIRSGTSSGMIEGTSWAAVISKRILFPVRSLGCYRRTVASVFTGCCPGSPLRSSAPCGSLHRASPSMAALFFRAWKKSLRECV